MMNQMTVADVGMSEDKARSLASAVQRATRHNVEVRAEAGYFVVVYRAVPGDAYTLRDEQDWQWLSKRIRSS